MENNAQYFEICWPLNAQVSTSPVSYRLTAPEVGYIVRDCKARRFSPPILLKMLRQNFYQYFQLLMPDRD